jgi:hypothetical protein
MNENKSDRKLYTLKAFADKAKANDNAWPTEPALRALFLRSKNNDNGFASAFKKVSRRVLVDENEFWAAVDNPQEEKEA